MFHIHLSTPHKKLPSPNWDTIHSRSVPTSKKGTVRILLVEDDKRLAGLIQRMLEGERYSVDILYDGSEGAELALPRHPRYRHHRLDAARQGRTLHLPRHPYRQTAHGDPAAHGTQPGRGPRGGTGQRSRRLPDQTVCSR